MASLRAPKTFDEDREIWTKVVEKLKLGQMPPPGFLVAAETVSAVTKWLEAEFARQDRATKPEPGRVTARRLNRTEYNNTIRDLLDVDFNPAEDFPADTAASGRQHRRRADVVEPEMRVSTDLGRVDIHAEQVADGVVVFGTVETAGGNPSA